MIIDNSCDDIFDGCAGRHGKDFICAFKLLKMAVNSGDNRFYMEALEINPSSIKAIDNQTEELCLAAVSAYGLAIRHVKNKTEEVCFAAVRNNGLALRYIENQTDEMCLVAVESVGCALEYVKNKTNEICVAALYQDGEAFEFIENKTNELCLLAVKQNWRNLKLVENQTDEMCLAAIRDDSRALRYVKNQNKEIIDLALKKSLWSFLNIDAKFYDPDYGQINDIYRTFAMKNEDYSYNEEKEKSDRINFSNKISEVLNMIDDDEILRASENELKDIFSDNINPDLIGDLYNLKQKVEMLKLTGKINNNKNKQKIL